MTRTIHPLVSLLVPLAVALTACGEQGSEPDVPEAEGAEEAQPLDPEVGDLVDGAEPGDVVEVEDGITVQVPEPGNLVAVEVMYEDGNTAVATLVNDEERGVFILHPDDHMLGLPEGTAAACATKCNDNSFSFLFAAQNVRAKWKSRLDWSYRHNNSPIGKNNAIEAFRSAARAVPIQRNSCGQADQSSATQLYLGETTRAPNITKSGSVISCGSPDGHNVVGWGAIAGGTLAVTCTHAQNDGTNTFRIIEADQRYDNTNRGWYAGNAVPASCTNRFSLRGVATHEFGHAYGLGHTPAQCSQVMAATTGPCSSAIRKFGTGDTRGIRNLY